MAFDAAAIRRPIELKGLPGRSWPARGFDVTGVADVSRLLAEGFATRTIGTRRRLLVYRNDRGCMVAELADVTRDAAGEPAYVPFRWAYPPSPQKLNLIVRQWWPMLGVAD